MQTIKLQRPILVDGERIHELAYDTDAITAEQFIEAEAYAANVAASRQRPYNKIAELDNGFHLALGMEAVIATNESLSLEDLSRVRGFDLMRLMEIGRNFTMGSAEEDAAEETEPNEESGFHEVLA